MASTCYIVAHAELVDGQVVVLRLGKYSEPPWMLTQDLRKELAMIIAEVPGATFDEALKQADVHLATICQYNSPLAALVRQEKR